METNTEQTDEMGVMLREAGVNYEIEHVTGGEYGKYPEHWALMTGIEAIYSLPATVTTEDEGREIYVRRILYELNVNKTIVKYEQTEQILRLIPGSDPQIMVTDKRRLGQGVAKLEYEKDDVSNKPQAVTLTFYRFLPKHP
jgi:hypothetical protein